MNTRTTSKSALFLMELILAIFFFSMASAVCIQLFVKAHMLGEDTTNKNHGVLWAQNIAEVYLGNDADINHILDTLQAVPDSDTSFSLYFDDTWNPCLPTQAIYTASVEIAEQDTLHTAEIVIRSLEDSTEPIYELSVSKHLPLQAE